MLVPAWADVPGRRSCSRTALLSRRRAALGAAVVAALSAADSRGADWDPVPGVAGVGNSSVEGGTGLWSTGVANWTSNGGLNNSNWINGDAAVFGGTAGGTVMIIDGGVSASSVSFDLTGNLTTYTLESQTSSDVLLMAGGAITTHADARINAVIGGVSGFSKLGSGTLTLGGDSTLIGNLTLVSGTLELATSTGAGNASIIVNSNTTLRNNAGLVTNAITLAGGAMGYAGDDATFAGPISVTAASNISAGVAGRTLTLSGVLSGTSSLSIDTGSGGALLVNNAANFNGSANTFTGNVSIIGSGSATLAYRIAAPAGQTFEASGGILTLGGQVAGASVHIAQGATVQAMNNGVVNLYGRAAAPGLGTIIGGSVIASGGGRVHIGDGLDDAAQIQLLSTALLGADGGTISLRPKQGVLNLDGTNGGLAIANGGVLALGPGGGDLVLNTDVTQSGAWVLANEGSNTFTIAGNVQDTTAGLALRAQGGVLRYDVTSTGVDAAEVNGSVKLEMRGGTFDLSNAGSGRTLVYADNHTLAGWGQVGTSASNLSHVIPAAGATFHASGSSGATLAVLGAFEESSGGKARFQIGDGNTLVLNIPNASGNAYQAGSITIDSQSGSNSATLVVAGGTVAANAASFITPSSKVRLEIQGGMLISDVTGTDGILIDTPGSRPISVSSGGSYISTASSFTLGAGQTIGGNGNLFSFNGTASTALVLHGTVDLNGALGARIAGSTGTLRLDAGETLVLTEGADLSGMSLGYAGISGVALLEINNGTQVARIATTTQLTTPDGPFTAAREFKVTGGTLQVDSNDPANVSITGVNQLTVPRASGALTGTLTLNNGTFYVGATNTAFTTMVDPSGALLGRGTYGHNGTNDTFINNGTVIASAGNLRINGGTIRATGTFNPNGQTLTLAGNLRDGSGTTTLRISGSSGGTVLLAGTTSNYTGGTIVENLGGSGPILRVTSSNVLGTGSITLSGGLLEMRTDSGLSYTSTPVVVQGTLGSAISVDRLTNQSSKNVRFSTLSLGGQTLSLAGANSYKLFFNNGTTVRAGAPSTLTTSGGGGVTMDLGALNLQGNLNVVISSSIVDIGALSGSGSLTRTGNSGTLELLAAASGFTGSFNMNTVGGITIIKADNALAGGTWNAGTLGNSNGTFNVTNSLGLNLSSGTVSGGSFNLGSGAVLGSMNGAQVHLAGGTIFANVAGALGSGTVTMTGGQLRMRGDAATAFGGNVIIRGGNSVLVDRFTANTGQIHSINSLGVIASTMNLSGLNGVGLAVSGDTTISGSSTSTIVNNASNLNLNRLLLNASLGLNGTGTVSIATLAGSGALIVGIDPAATLAITSTPEPGFAGSVQVAQGTVNLNSVAGSLAGGNLSVTGGTLNLGVSGALGQAGVLLSSGFIYANAPDALGGQSLTITNGSLVAGVNNALGGSVITMTGGNITAQGAGSLGTAAITMNRGILALRSDTPAAFGGSVAITGTNFATISVASINPALVVANSLSIASLSLGGQTLNITGDGRDTLVVSSAVALSGTNPTTFNTTAADGMIVGAVTGSGGVIKSGSYKMTFDEGGNFGTARINAGTLVVNGAWTSSGVTVGGSNGAATLELGGSGSNTLSGLAINAGKLRIAKSDVSAAIPSTALPVATSGHVTIQYAGLSTGTLANTINVDASLGSRTLTLSSGSGALVSQSSTLLFTGSINRTGTNALSVVVVAEQTLDDGLGNLVRPPSRTVMVSNQTFTAPIIHGGGIVIAKGNLAAIGAPTPTPLGQSTNALSLLISDSTIGVMPADGQAGASFGRTVTTSGDWMRLGGFYNPSGAAGVQTVQFLSGASFAWNGTNGLSAVFAATSPTSGATLSRWNGLYAEPQTVLQINSGSILDNVISVSGTNVTSAAPVYVGGGGTVRLGASFDASLNTGQVRGLSGLIGVLDGTTLQSLTGGKHFDGVQLLGGTFQVGGTNQTLAGGLQAQVSPVSAQASSNLVADSNLTITGVGTAKAFKIGNGAALLRSGTGTLSLNGDHNHDPGSIFRADQGVTHFNTDAGSASKSNFLSVTVSNGASVNFNVSQHLADLAVHSGIAQLSSGSNNGSKVLDVTSVTTNLGKLDITNNRLVVDYAPGNSPLVSLAAQITSGYNAGGAKWTGNGITSSTAAGNPMVYAIGFGEASDLLGSSGGAFDSETVDGSSVLARFTRLGDANLDGVVDLSDLARLASRYGLSGSWATGDFNFDGLVTLDDLALIAANYGMALGSEAVPSESVNFSADWATAFASVPEPGAMSTLVAGAALMLRRRRRR